jgi:anti-sigma factor RsiW
MTRRLDERLSAYLDGELSGRERAELEPALREPETARQLDALRALERGLRDLPPIGPSDDFAARFRARLERERAARREPWWRALRSPGPGRVFAGAAAIAAALALAIWLQRRPQPLGPDLEQVAEVRDPETWEMLRSEDVELLEVLEILEAWDGVQES